MSYVCAIIMQDLRLAVKQGSGTGHLLAFFVISSVLFAFGIGSDPQLLQSIGAGVIWVCALLSSMLAVPKIFDDDFADGSLAQIYLQGQLMEKTIIAKIISNWLISCLPIIAILPLLLTLFHIENQIFTAITSLSLATPTICSISTLGAALTLGIKRGSGLISIIILPLYIPVLIFGVNGNSTILLALLMLMLPVSIFAASAAVKMALED